MLKVYTLFTVAIAAAFYFYVKESTTLKKTEFVETLNRSYDYIVVGSGSAGSTVAGRLSENDDVTVLLLEAGGDDRGEELVKSKSQNGLAVVEQRISRHFYTQQQNNLFQAFENERAMWPRGVVLGGTSSISGMMYVRGSRHDYNNWAKHTGDKTWDYSHVLPYFIRAEGTSEPSLMDSPYHGTDGPQSISVLGKNSKLADKIVEAFEELGYPHNKDYNGKTMEGVAYAQANIHENKHRMSCAMSYIHPNLDRTNLHVSINSFVQRVVFNEGKRAIGVEVIKNNRKVFVRANKEVILSAGAIQSPQILMLSGVGPKAHLEKLGIPVVADLPVGQNLQDHALVIMSISIDAPLKSADDEHGQENLFFTSTTEDTKAMDWPDLQMMALSRGAYRSVFEEFWSMKKSHVDEILPHRHRTPYEWQCLPALLRPASRGNLKLASTDPFDDPIILSNYFEKEEDLDVLLKGVQLCHDAANTKVMQKAGARVSDPVISLCKQHPSGSTEYWKCYIRATVGTIFHYAGTCHMGKETDPKAVVDSKLKVKHVQGLRVADASIMPFLPSANTHGPVVMIGEKAADMILGRKPLAPLKNL